MPSGINTSSIFYKRGVPYNFKDFGTVTCGAYGIYQPTKPIYNSAFFRKSISNLIRVSRN